MLRSTFPARLLTAMLMVVPCWATAQSVPPAPTPAMHEAASGDTTPATPLAWSSLSPLQAKMLAPLQGQWAQMHPGQQQRLAEHARHWATLPAERQQQIRERLARWAAMTPEQRQQLRANARAFHDLTPAERTKVRAAFERFRALPPAEREALRERWHAMPPQQRLHWMTEHADRPIPMHAPGHRGH